MKRMLAVALFATAVSCMAQQPQIRIDVNGMAEKIALAPVKSEQGFVVDNPGWMKENKECYLAVFGKGRVRCRGSRYRKNSRRTSRDPHGIAGGTGGT